MGLYLAYCLEIYSFKITNKHLENFVIAFSLHIFRDDKFSVLFIWTIWHIIQSGKLNKAKVGSEQGSIEVSKKINLMQIYVYCIYTLYL